MAPRQMCGSPGTVVSGEGGRCGLFPLHTSSQWGALAILRTQAEAFQNWVSYDFIWGIEPVVGLHPRCGVSNQYQPSVRVSRGFPVMHTLKLYPPPGTSNVPVFRDRSRREVIQVKTRPLGWAFIQLDWCPYNKRKFGHMGGTKGS